VAAPAGNSRKSAVFFDRDGTVVYDTGYLRDSKLIKFYPSAIPVLSRLQKRGYALVLVSNQSGVGRGLISTADAQRVHDAIVKQLFKSKVKLDGAYYCFHAPEANCDCRKPSPQLLLRAADDLNIDLSRSFMIGDRISDIEAGRLAGCYTILLSKATGTGASRPHRRVRNWKEIERTIGHRSNRKL
jgi:D-glycero-D-manno-heptose 1,7-bisphosphate phosphatase